MTLSVSTPANTSGPTPASNRLAPTRRAASNASRVFRNAAASLGKAIVILGAYRVALKRLEAGAEANLFDEPVLWAELKSVAWAEAGAAAERRKDRLPFVGLLALGLSFVLAISFAGLWRP